MTPHPSSCRAAFTLVEVLTALAVLAIATYVVASALIALARTQRLLDPLKRGGLTVRTVETRRWLTNVMDIPTLELNGWTARAVTRTDDSSEIARRWRVWTLSPTDHPSLQVGFSEPLLD